MQQSSAVIMPGCLMRNVIDEPMNASPPFDEAGY